MLPAEHRLRASADFGYVIRTGRRAGRATVVLHLAGHRAPEVPAARMGLVVGRSIGNSVMRHRVSRRLRAQLAERMARVPADCDVVVRARPAAAGATSAQLGADIDSALTRLLLTAAR